MIPPPYEYLHRASFQDGIFTRAMELGCCPVLATTAHHTQVWLCGCMDMRHATPGAHIITKESLKRSEATK